MGFAEDSATGEAITIGCLVIRDGNTRIATFDLARSIIRRYFSKPTMMAESGQAKSTLR
jgi:hypothetical protein